jgi:WD domain, G-beta repeat
MAPGGRVRRSALLITTAAYADTQLLWLRPPVSGAHDLAAALADPRAGGFAVDMLADGTETEARLAIQRFLAGRSADETVVLYLACHAIRDRARLYFAATDTWLRYPQRSALPASAVMGELDLCGAGNRVLILDCCFSGGFAEEKGELDLAEELGLHGRGIALLSGSRAREYSYEGRPIGAELPRSVFTEGLAVGLATGAADTDGNGIVTVAEAYNYAYRHVSQNAPRQAPLYYLEDGQGDIVLARAQPRTGPQAYVPMDAPPPVPPPRYLGGHQTGSFAPIPDAPPPGRPATMPPRGNAGGQGATAPQPTLAPAAGPSLPAHAKPAEVGGGVVLEQDRDNAYCVAFSPDGVLLASGGWGRPVRLRDVMNGGLVRELRSVGPSIYDLAFSPDGALIATGGRDGTVALCEVASGKKGRTRKPGGAAVRAVAFAPDGRLLVSAHEDGVARLWDIPALGRVHELHADGETVFGAAFSPDGTLVACACADGAVRLWSTADGGEPLTVLRRHVGWATGVAFTPDGMRLVSSGADGSVLLHDAMTGEVSEVLRGGDGIVNAIALSPDGSLIVGAYETGALTVWEVETGHHETAVGHAGHVNDVAFSPHGRALASAGKDGTVRLWR